MTWAAYREGTYEVSDMGDVRNATTGRVLAGYVGKAGYRVVTICRAGHPKERGVYVHRMVAEAFLGTCPAGLEVNHRNGLKIDNAADNLEYVTPSANILHAWATGLIRDRNMPVGEAHHQAKLTEGAVRDIRRRHAEGEPVARLAREFGVDRALIRRIADRRIWRHVA